MKLESTKVLQGLRGENDISLEYMGSKLNLHRETYRKYEKNPLLMTVEKTLETLEILQADKDKFFYALTQDYLSCKTTEKEIKKEES